MKPLCAGPTCRREAHDRVLHMQKQPGRESAKDDQQQQMRHCGAAPASVTAADRRAQGGALKTIALPAGAAGERRM